MGGIIVTFETTGGGEMEDRAFVIMQVGAKESPERKRADEIYEFVVVPAVRDAGLQPYRADLDLSPGPITPKMLAELLGARVVIADLTGRNPNVYYELGITHSFVRPLISIADSPKSLPFDAKDERIIELGEYPASGLGYAQGRRASDSLRESLDIVLADGYTSPSPLRDVAANRSVDDLAPKDPVAAEMTQVREALEEIRRNMTPKTSIPPYIREDIETLRAVIHNKLRYFNEEDVQLLIERGSRDQKKWADEIYKEWQSLRLKEEDPWASDSGYSDEPPF